MSRLQPDGFVRFGLSAAALLLGACQLATTPADTPGGDAAQPTAAPPSLSTRASIAPITGETTALPVPPLPPPPPPPCDCYYNADCWFGWVCPVTGSCAVNTNAQGKIRDGECTFFLWASFESPEARLLAASAFEDYTSAISEAAVAGGQPSQPLPDLRGDVLAGTTLVEVEVLAMNLAVLVFGRADIHDGHAHEPGYVDVSGVDPKLTAGGMTGRLRLEPAPQATRAVFDHAATAMAAYLRSPDIEVLSAAMDGLSEAAPGFQGHGNCQTPHPVANHHAFEYRDAFDCVAREIAHMVGPIERRLDGSRR